MPEPAPSAPEPASPGPSPRERLRGALMRPSRGQAVAAVLLALLGFAGVTQVHATESDDDYDGYREQELIDLLNGTAAAAQRAEAEIEELERTRADLRSDTLRRRTALQEANKEADTLSILAGLAPVHGPGIRMTVDDPEGAVDTEVLLDTIEELRTAGAEAIEFNDEVRVVAQSSFEEGFGGIEVDGQLLPSPYVIEAIGEPSTLEGGMELLSGPIDDIEEAGGSVELERLEDVEISSVKSLDAFDPESPG
jgi:uncharacterized protein YlxW (UPF0749 family)